MQQNDFGHLYNVFEKHLFNSDSNTDRKTFVMNVVKEYITTLRSHSLHVPAGFESGVIEELCNEVNLMLTKKIYGFLTIEDFQGSQSRVKSKS